MDWITGTKDQIEASVKACDANMGYPCSKSGTTTYAVPQKHQAKIGVWMIPNKLGASQYSVSGINLVSHETLEAEGAFPK